MWRMSYNYNIASYGYMSYDINSNIDTKNEKIHKTLMKFATYLYIIRKI